VSARGPAGRTAVPLALSGRGVVITPAVRALVEAKLARLARALPNLLDARVVCTAEKFRRTVRITLRARRGTFASAATAPELATAVDAALEALRRQTREAKERRTAGMGRAARRRRVAGPGLDEPSA
jgi:ribosomal subunit interface protein